MVPIMRSFLAKYYDRYPFSPTNGDLTGIGASLDKEVERLDAERLKSEVSWGLERICEERPFPLFATFEECKLSERTGIQAALNDKVGFLSHGKIARLQASVITGDNVCSHRLSCSVSLSLVLFPHSFCIVSFASCLVCLLSHSQLFACCSCFAAVLGVVGVVVW